MIFSDSFKSLMNTVPAIFFNDLIFVFEEIRQFREADTVTIISGFFSVNLGHDHITDGQRMTFEVIRSVCIEFDKQLL